MTAALCILGCRIRGRHLPTCETPDDPQQCGGCLPRTADDGLSCQPCLDRVRERLDAIAELAPDARLVAAGLVRRGGGGGSGKPGSRPPLNDGATDLLSEIAHGSLIRKTRGLVTIAKAIARTRGLTLPHQVHHADLTATARWLTTQLDWLRHATDATGQPWCVPVFAEITDAAGRMRGLVNGPGEQKYLGPCGARLTMACETCEREISVGEAYAPQPGTGGLVDCAEHAPFIGDIRLRQTDTCQGDVYAYRGASAGRCRLCGAEVSSRDREAWLDGEVRDRAFRASEISAAYGLKANTIRVWHARGRLHEVSRDHDDRPLFNVGDVLDLAAADAIRRHEAAVKRARRQAQHEPA